MLLDSNEPNIIWVDSDITTNQIWMPDYLYYVTTSVNVQALLVIEPGTEIRFAPYAALYVNNGGTLISVGEPNSPIFYTSEYSNPPPWLYYYCAIYVEETASPATRIAYNFIDLAWVAIATDNIRLDTPIENNYLISNVYAIGENGTHHTDIVNNFVLLTWDVAIGAYMAGGFDEGPGDANSHILIQNNTCDWQKSAIWIDGVEDQNDAGTVMLINNIVTQSDACALNLVDGWVTGFISNTGYGSNYMNKNFDFNEYYPVEVNEYPYLVGPGPYDYGFLDQNCAFIDAGYQYIEETPLIGKTTDVNSAPDSNITDLGFHNPNWDYSNAGEGDYYAGDLDENLKVDLADFAILANGWQTLYGINDLASMTEDWLRVGGPFPNLQVVFEGDPNDINGILDVMIDRSNQIIGKVFLFVDGQMRDTMNTPVEWPMVVNSTCGLNGPHSFKVVGIDENYNIICGETTMAVFNNELSAVTMGKGYQIGKPYYLYAFGSPSAEYVVEVNDTSDGNTVYSEDFTGNIQAIIGSEAFVGDDLIYDLTVKNSSSPENPIINTMISKLFNIQDYPNARMVISVGSSDLEREDRCASVIKRVKNEAEVRIGVGKIITLPYAESTWDTVRECLSIPTVKIGVHFGHGNYGWTSWWNQVVQFNGGLVSAFDSWWYDHSMTELGFQQSKRLNFVFFHTCYGAYTPQFAEALGVLPKDNPLEIGTRAFISWDDRALYRDAYAMYNTYMNTLWDQLGYGATLRDAKRVAQESSGGQGWRISEDLCDYGVGILGSGDDEIYFDYPYINGHH